MVRGRDSEGRAFSWGVSGRSSFFIFHFFSVESRLGFRFFCCALEMGSVDRADDRTFRVNFSSDGVARLRDRVMDKLKEFMGDYTDDTLVVRIYF